MLLALVGFILMVYGLAIHGFVAWQSIGGAAVLAIGTVLSIRGYFASTKP